MRPSVWISPREDWGEGHVELIEIPTAWETNSMFRATCPFRRSGF
nr:glucan biosynthesis protein [Acetomicrobium sp. S15 = DSM 107314]